MRSVGSKVPSNKTATGNLTLSNYTGYQLITEKICAVEWECKVHDSITEKKECAEWGFKRPYFPWPSYLSTS